MGGSAAEPARHRRGDGAARRLRTERALRRRARSPPAPARRSCRTPTSQGRPSRSTCRPDAHALVLSTYADSDGTQLARRRLHRGRRCRRAREICFDLTVVPGADGARSLGVDVHTAPRQLPRRLLLRRHHLRPRLQGRQRLRERTPTAAASHDALLRPDFAPVRRVRLRRANARRAPCTDGRVLRQLLGRRTSCATAPASATRICCTAADCSMPPARRGLLRGHCSAAGGSLLRRSRPAAGVRLDLLQRGQRHVQRRPARSTCTAGFADCDGDPSNGCETNLGAAGKKLCDGTASRNLTAARRARLHDAADAERLLRHAGSCPASAALLVLALTAARRSDGSTCCNARQRHLQRHLRRSPARPASSTATPTPPTAARPAARRRTAPAAARGGACGIGSLQRRLPRLQQQRWPTAASAARSAAPTRRPACRAAWSRHINGIGAHYSDCFPLGMPGNTTTQAALPTWRSDAAVTDTSQAGTVRHGFTAAASSSTSRRLQVPTGAHDRAPVPAGLTPAATAREPERPAACTCRPRLQVHRLLVRSTSATPSGTDGRHLLRRAPTSRVSLDRVISRRVR